MFTMTPIEFQRLVSRLSKTNTAFEIPNVDDIEVIAVKVGPRTHHCILMQVNGESAYVPMAIFRKNFGSSESAHRKLSLTLNDILLNNCDNDYDRIELLAGKTIRIKKQVRTFNLKIENRMITKFRNLRINKHYYKIPMFEIVDPFMKSFDIIWMNDKSTVIHGYDLDDALLNANINLSNKQLIKSYTEI